MNKVDAFYSIVILFENRFELHLRETTLKKKILISTFLLSAVLLVAHDNDERSKKIKLLTQEDVIALQRLLNTRARQEVQQKKLSGFGSFIPYSPRNHVGHNPSRNKK